MSRICKLQGNKANYQLSLCPGSLAWRTGTEGKARGRVGQRESLKGTSQYIKLEIFLALRALPASSPPSCPGPSSGSGTSPSEKRMSWVGVEECRGRAESRVWAPGACPEPPTALQEVGWGCTSWTCWWVGPSANVWGWALVMAVGGSVALCLYFDPSELL